MINIRWSMHFYIAKKWENLKICFLKQDFFKIPFFKSHNSVNSWVRDLREVSFDSKFLTGCHTDWNSIPTKWDLFADGDVISLSPLYTICEQDE